MLPTRDFPYELLPAEPIYRRQWWKNLRWPFLALRLHARRGPAPRPRSSPRWSSAPGGTPRVRWSGAPRDGAFPPRSRSRTPIPGWRPAGSLARVREVWLGVPEAAPALTTRAADRGAGHRNSIAPPDPGRRGQRSAAVRPGSGRPVLLVTGGSQGALAINQARRLRVDRLRGAEGIQVLWAAGKATLRPVPGTAPPPAVQVFDFLDPMADAYAVATLAVSRAGMMTVAELAAWGVPSMLVPLPTAAADHQTPNARVMADAGAAIHLPQAELSAEAPGPEAGRRTCCDPPIGSTGWPRRRWPGAAPTPRRRYRPVSGFFRGRGALSQVAVPVLD